MTLAVPSPKQSAWQQLEMGVGTAVGYERIQPFEPIELDYWKN